MPVIFVHRCQDPLVSTVGRLRVHTEAGRTGDETHPAVRKLHTTCTRAGHTVSGVPVELADWQMSPLRPCGIKARARPPHRERDGEPLCASLSELRVQGFQMRKQFPPPTVVLSEGEVVSCTTIASCILFGTRLNVTIGAAGSFS